MATDSDVSDIRKEFQQAGFEVFGEPNLDAFEVKKDDCVWTVTRKDNRWVTTGPPWFIRRRGFPFRCGQCRCAIF